MKFFEELDYAYYTWFQEEKIVLIKIMCFSLFWCALLNVSLGGDLQWYHVVNCFVWGVVGYHLDDMATELARIVSLIFKKRR